MASISASERIGGGKSRRIIKLNVTCTVRIRDIFI